MSPITDPSHLEALLDRQVKSWELRQRLAREGGEEAVRELAHLPQGPWITFSKQLGSEGLELAHEVGRRLGWQVFDREILEAISRQTNWREQVLSRLDEKVLGSWAEWISHLVVPGHPARASFLKEMLRVIGGIAQQGRAVLVGRGANWILDPQYGLRVRAIAPLETRAERVARREGIDRSAALARIAHEDESAAAFVRSTYRRNIDDATGYDLVVNLGSLKVDAAADGVLASLRRKLGGAG